MWGLASWLPSCYTGYLHWLRHLLERLGRQGALSIWQDAYQSYDDGLTVQILSTGWNDIGQNKVLDAQETIATLFSRFFPVPIEGVSQESAKQGLLK